MVVVLGILGTFHFGRLLGSLLDVVKNLLLFELSILEFGRDNQVLGGGIIDHLLFLFSGNSLDFLNMRFGSFGSHLLVGLTLLTSSTDLLKVVLERSLPLLLTLLSGFLSLVNLAGDFSGLLDFEADDARSELISGLQLGFDFLTFSLDDQVS